MLHLTSDHSTQVLYGATNSSGYISAQYDFTGEVAIDGWVRQWDLSGEDYTPKDISGIITASGFSLIVNLEPI